MKIDSTYKPSSTPTTTRPVARAAPESPPAAESVNLSQLASAMQGNEKPPINAACIQEIKEAIADGLIQSARDLLDSQRKA